jgi:tetratricopeptide (TPR) repeat protein
MGKSALTWTWFNDLAPRQMQPLVGRLWWSFYESDATFENFVVRALAYVARRPREEVQSLPAPEREERLLAILDREPFLVVLDGLERLLVAYARFDAARLADDDLDERTANAVAGAWAQPRGTMPSTGQHRLRRTADARVGSFLRKLASVRSARILISTRLYPADLQTVTGAPAVGCSARILRGLGDDDALSLWRAFGVGGSPEVLLPLFQSCENYPLLIRALAGEVARYRRAPGDFDRWRRDHPEFEPSRLPLVQIKSHVLSFALHGMDEATRAALNTVAAFRMPASYDTLAALLVGTERPFADEVALDVALAELEDRGLLGWDRRANRYDLHPIVRSVAWDGLDADAKRGLYGNLQRHFDVLPATARDDVACIEDLSPAVELYNALVGLGRQQDAWDLFWDRLFSPMQFRLSCTRQLIEFLEMLRSGEPGHVPKLDSRSTAQWLRALAEARHRGGQPGLATPLYRECIERSRGFGDIVHNEYMLADALLLAGALREAEGITRTVLHEIQSSVGAREVPARRRSWGNINWTAALYYCRLGQVLTARGDSGPADAALRRALEIFVACGAGYREGGVRALLAQRALGMGQFAAAGAEADRAWDLAHQKQYERDFVRASRLQGAAALGLDNRGRADERLGHAIVRARAIGCAEEELPALIALAELRRRRQGDLDAARELLEDAWEPAERGPYPLFHADALNVLARVERDAGRRDAAIAAASAAYRQAWCDGPPFAYHWGLEVARMHLANLGAPEPGDLPRFDEAAHAPMSIVAID